MVQTTAPRQLSQRPAWHPQCCVTVGGALLLTKVFQYTGRHERRSCHATDTAHAECGFLATPAPGTGMCALRVRPSTRGTAQRTPHWHLFSLVTVAVLSPTNSYVLLLYPVPELHSTCPSTYATGSTEPGDSHDTCASHSSHLSQVDEKKAKNCAQKHMGVPGCAVR